MMDSQVTSVKQKTDIVAVINERVTLKKAGRNFRGLCPFHGEKTPSFFVSAEMQMFKCFGCGVSGDVLSFIQQYEGLTFPEALEYLAKKVGVVLTHEYKGSEDNKRERLLAALHLADELYSYILLNHSVGRKALAYLKDRGITMASIKDFHIGYAPENWETVTDYLMKKKGYKGEELEAVGLAIRSGRGRYYDRFRGRVMFPLKNYAGQIVGFSGRLLDKEAKEAKYINSPETSLYHKGELLFGLSLTKQFIRQKDRVIVVEGEMDVISSYQVGVKEVVAIKGSALTEAQILLLRRLTKNIILSLDADEAGQEAMNRGITLAERMGVNLRAVRIKGGKDPDELARSNKEEWKKCVDSAKSIYEYLMDRAFEKYDVKTGLGQKQISKEMALMIGKIENAVERSFYQKKLASMLGVLERVMSEEVEKARLHITEPESKPIEVKKKGRREKLERYVVGLLLQLTQKWADKLKEFKKEWISEIYLRRLIEELQKGGERVKTITEAIDKLPEEMQAVIKQLYTEEMDFFEMSDEEAETLYDKAVADLVRYDAREKLVELSKKMGKAEDKSDDQRNLQEEYRRVSKEMV